MTSAACPLDVSNTSTPASYSTALNTAPTVRFDALNVTRVSSGTTAALYVSRNPARCAMAERASPKGTSFSSSEIGFRKTAASLASFHRCAASLERLASTARNRGPAAASSTPGTGSWAFATPIAPAMVIPAPRATTAPHRARVFASMRILDLPFAYRAVCNVEIVTDRPCNS